MIKTKNLVIIGAGPSGLMACVSAKIHNPEFQITILEKNSDIGKKLSLTGGGRCNLTVDVNNSEFFSGIYKNASFLFSSIYNFGPRDIMKFFESNNIKLKKEGPKVYLLSNDAKEIIKFFENFIKNNGIKIIYNAHVNSIDITKSVLVFNNFEEINYDFTIISTGGMTYKNTGSSGDGYTLAKSIGHNITNLMPAEIPLVSNDLFIQNKVLQGICVKNVELSVKISEKKVYRVNGDLIFTHFGISGPASLMISHKIVELLNIGHQFVDLLINFLPNQNALKEQVDVVVLQKYLPKRLVSFLESQTSFPSNVNYFNIRIVNTLSFDKAFVTNGGVNVLEVNSSNMKSKINPRISFSGEILDVCGFTGGYNLTIAWSTGYLAGQKFAKK